MPGARKRDLERPFHLTATELEALSLKHLEAEEAARRMRIKVGSYKHMLLRAREKMQINFTKSQLVGDMAATPPSNSISTRSITPRTARTAARPS